MRARMRFWMGGLSAAAVFGFNANGALAACPMPVNSIDSFICCVNSKVPAGGNVSNAVQCLPPGCSVTLTMSDQSAQAACTLGTCQLPRVLLTCPGPAPGRSFRPSFLLCPQDSGTAPEFGMDRVELGEDTANGDMIMADVPFPPGHVPVPFDDSVKSMDNGGSGTKSCNDTSIGCHASGMPQGMLDTSKPIDPFGNPIGKDSINGSDYIISTDDECKEASPDTTKFMPQALADICSCIATNRAQIAADATPGEFEKKMNVLLALCQALKNYQYSRGVCGGVFVPNGGAPQLCPPSCSESGINGRFSQSSQSFPVNISVTGATTYPAGSNPTYTYVQPNGIIGVADPVTGNTITGSAFTSAKLASLGGGNFTFNASANVRVNGTLTAADFTVTKTGTTLGYTIKKHSNSQVLSTGTGVPGKSWFAVGFAPPK
jgi:hypothetical protein